LPKKDYYTANYRPPGFLDGSAGAVLFYVGYFVAILLPVLFAFILFGDFSDGAVLVIGKAFALTAFAIFSMQVVLGSRLKTLDRALGLDKILRFHKLMAIIGTSMIILHPLLVMIGHDDFSILGFRSSLPIIAGEIGLLFLPGGVAAALFRSKLKLDYNVWHLFHKGMIVVIIIGFYHSTSVGSDIYGGMKSFWWVVFATAITVFLFRNIVFPIFVRRRYEILSVDAETHDTYTIRMKPANGKLPRYRPGQFMFLKLKRKKGKSEEHPFTISSSPTLDGEITATIKESGNFTDTIGETTVEDSARIAAPYGKFSFIYDEPARFLFIAGGVGITPIMSMIRFLRDTGDGRPVKLLFANKSEKDILFRDEISVLPENFAHVHVLSRPDESWTGRTGYIDEKILRQDAGEYLDDCTIYLCGPPPMMTAVEKEIEKTGYRGEVRTEKFSLD